LNVAWGKKIAHKRGNCTSQSAEKTAVISCRGLPTKARIETHTSRVGEVKKKRHGGVPKKSGVAEGGDGGAGLKELTGKMRKKN